MTYRLLAILLLAVLPVLGAEAEILKVLPHFVDAKGLHTLSPSLFERDAYQAHLRENPELIAALRYDVQWKGPRGPMTLRVELRGTKTGIATARTFETDVKADLFFSTWSSLRIDQKTYAEIGPIIAWRATLWRDDQQLAEQKSFLW